MNASDREYKEQFLNYLKLKFPNFYPVIIPDPDVFCHVELFLDPQYDKQIFTIQFKKEEVMKALKQ